MSQTVRDLRHATRCILRELNVLEDKQCATDLALRECHALLEIGNAGQLGVNQLAELLVLEKSTVSRLVTGLEDKGMVICESDPRDRRTRRASLTADGVEKLSGIHAMADNQTIQALAYCSDEEVAQMLAAQQRYASALAYSRMNSAHKIRPIREDDDPAIASIIRTVMTEFGAVGCGFSIEDPEVDGMHSAYGGDKARYFVIDDGNGKVVGGGGIGPLPDAEEGTCELKKMYFLPEARGRGLAVPLLKQCLVAASACGYDTIYLETLDHMHQAQKLYRRFGFQPLEKPMGNTGHFKCNTFMARSL